MEVIVIGAGSRSNTYSTYFLENPNAGKIIALTEPNQQRRMNFAQKFKIPEKRQFPTGEEVFEQKSRIGTLCDHHVPIAIRSSNAGYKIILENPISHKLEESLDLYDKVLENETQVSICHVMRYHPLLPKIKGTRSIRTT
jgi:predicted dehydrogenase